ncbi:hypothetical protein BX616_003755 [Lobosporangium transversale]|uniref:Uncharacterized protein n=1 Tax=Lobosporangium transversale TaxID=64571 RepID=A0A1Y2H270_9FUNG|nr:hypothetical protein BCR41DRAFT_347517 [Lobosporangium transversale]KAF9916436.1 hypothetical protein BX616_003755 [Lobosporangium transversale]ORZ27152.1 hypothetical protein BCR41DRAFT_347517 [Lobosporangium transversale]|eukprot:XP_021884899.1 hypothetical protein BCR41DRAFT_347517 [Lobosporangium transversale]
MSIILLQDPVVLRNPFSVLDAEHEDDNTVRNTNENNNVDSLEYVRAYSNIQSRAMLTRAISEDDLDNVSVSSWSVVTSAFGSDDEDSYSDDDEIILDSSANHIAPLTVSALSDGFTNISKTMTATSINSSAVATAEPSAWVVKVSKKRQRSRKPKIMAATAPTLDDVIEGYESESLGDDDSDFNLELSMTEHEISKSARAVTLKNKRLADAHDLGLCKTLGITMHKVKHAPQLPRGIKAVYRPPVLLTKKNTRSKKVAFLHHHNHTILE